MPWRSGLRRESAVDAHGVELNSIDERVLVDRSGVCGALAQCLAVELAGTLDIVGRYRGERHQLDAVDLNLAEPNCVASARLDPRLLPQSYRERDVARQDATAQLAAELHVCER